MNLITRKENFAEWYTQVCVNAKLFTYADVKGAINYLPNGWKIWELIKENLDKKLQALGSKNVQLPLFIKASEFAKETSHIDGFSPEVFTVTKIGNEPLIDPLYVRPTSEVLFSQLFKSEVRSYHDLPIKYNQWCSVYRAEKNTKPFLRGCEFFWHELHCLFVNEQEAMNYALEIHQLYNEFLKDVCYLPALSGKKTEGEKFAGAEITYTREAWSQDGQCIQTGTSHYLGQNFSKIYDIKFQTKENNFAHPYYTSHGITTRIIGDLIVVHGDDKGIVLPFALAPIQIAILPILGDKEPKVLVKAKEIANELDIYRVNIDESTNSFGYKISNQEALGTPFSIVIGPKDLENNTCVLISRDNGEKQTIALEKIKEVIKNEKMNYFKRMYNKADTHLQNSIIETQTLDQFKENVGNGKISLCYWGGDENDEKKIKELTGASPRCIKEELVNSDQRCFFTNKPAKALVYFARAY